MEMRPIAHIKTDLPQKFGIPRNSFLAPHLQGRIVFEPEFALPQAVDGLEEFSHLWLLWEFENGMPGGTAADIARDAAGPVSYTHLDVYKRQAPCRPLRELRQADGAARGRYRCV